MLVPPREARWSVHTQNTLGPFLILPLMAHWAKVTIHRAEGSEGFTEQGVVETVTTLPRTQATALCWPAEGRCEEWRRGRGSTQERRDQVPFRKHRKGPRGRVETATEQEQK